MHPKDEQQNKQLVDLDPVIESFFRSTFSVHSAYLQGEKEDKPDFGMRTPDLEVLHCPFYLFRMNSWPPLRYQLTTENLLEGFDDKVVRFIENAKQMCDGDGLKRITLHVDAPRFSRLYMAMWKFEERRRGVEMTMAPNPGGDTFLQILIDDIELEICRYV